MHGGAFLSSGCAIPLDFTTLVDYWLAESGEPDEERIEEHLFQCDDCGRRLAEIAALGAGVRRLARKGAVGLTVTPSFQAAASREGLRTREYRVPPGGSVACTVMPEDDLLVARLEGNFSGVSRLDLVSRLDDGPEQRMEDVPLGGAHELILAQAMPAMRALGRCVVRLRLLDAGPAGERLLGEYTFDHTPAGRSR
jgi:hypothetical protein